MATERLSSILNHLTPGKSGLSAMWVFFPAFNSFAIADNLKNPEEPRRCSHHVGDTNTPHQRFQRRFERHATRLYRLSTAEASSRQVKD